MLISNRGMDAFILSCPLQTLTKICTQGIAQNLFEGTVGPAMVNVVLASPRGRAQHHPVRRAIASSAETGGIDKGLQKIERMPVHLLPIPTQPASRAGQNVRCCMRIGYPRQ